MNLSRTDSSSKQAQLDEFFLKREARLAASADHFQLSNPTS